MKPAAKPKALWVKLAQRGRSRLPNGGLKPATVKKRVRPITKKQTGLRRQYLKQRRAFLATHRECEIYPWLPRPNAITFVDEALTCWTRRPGWR